MATDVPDTQADDEELEDEWRARITEHLPPRVAPDDWVVKAFHSGKLIAVALTLEDEDDTDEPITVAALAKIEAGTVGTGDEGEPETVWLFPGSRSWTVENAEESWDDAAKYLAGEIAKATN
ncbi:MAG: hypothetical protein C0467_21245 [Planctomycetaceae bacterium]|nr:hypothetical protein [Planctomycetaceae bacterium]